MKSYQLLTPDLFPEVKPGDDVAQLIIEALASEGCPLIEDDIVVIAHKIVSKAEGRVYRLADVEVSGEAEAIARKTGKDAALTELILRETKEVLVAMKNGLLISHHRLGYVCANAAADQSNAGDGKVILLPVDPDKSAMEIRSALEKEYGCSVGVIICDTHGKPFREGALGTVVGASGVQLLKSYIGEKDCHGRIMQSSVEAAGDELAGAATLLMGQGSEGHPFTVVRGISLKGDQIAADLHRKPEMDVFLTALKKMNKEDSHE